MKAGSQSSPGMFVRRISSDPSKFIINISFCPSTLDSKAMIELSGDIKGFFGSLGLIYWYEFINLGTSYPVK